MKTSTPLIALSTTIIVLALVAAGGGLLWPGDGSAFPFTTLRGETVRVWGQGLYRYDTIIQGSGYQGQDAVVLLVGLPLLTLSLLSYGRGSLRGALLLSGALAFFLYYALSMSFGAAYNQLFLVYVALLTTNLFALPLAVASIDLPTLPDHFSPNLPRLGIATYLFIVGLSLVGVWFGLSLLPAMLQGKAPPELAAYTTLHTHALDLGLIAPLAFLAAVLLLRRAPLGYLLAAAILVLSWTIGTSVVASAIPQLQVGAITPPQAIAFVVPFLILNLVGIGLTVVLFRHFREAA